MYNPFVKDGREIPFLSITLEDIQAFLSTPVKESIFFEFKSTFDDSVRGKIGPLISSFANERGGWILLGVSDADKSLVGVEQEDFDQVIGNILRSKVSPIPYYQLRALSIPSSAKQIIVIFVPEGVDAPYIVDGTAYRRIGNNSIGLQKIRDRYDFDSISQKTNKRRKLIRDFCHPKVSVFEREWISNQFISKGFYRYYGVISFYFVLPDVQSSDYLSIELSEVQSRIKDIMNATIKPRDSDQEVTFNLPFPRFSFARNSLVFRNNEDGSQNSRTLIWQISRNGWSRIHLPIPYLSLEAIEDTGVAESLREHEYRIIDGQMLSKAIFSIVNLLDHVSHSLFPDHNRYILDIKVKNVRNHIVYLRDSESYLRFFKNSHVPFVETKSFRLNPDLQISDTPLDWMQSFGLLQSLLMSFNIPPIDSIQMFLETLQLGKSRP